MHANTTKLRSRSRAATAAALTVMLAMSACVPIVDYHGYLPRSEDIQRVQVGQSKTEIQSILGSPSTTATIEREGDTYYYISSVVEKLAFFEPEVVDREILAVRFGPDNRVSNFGHYGLEDGRVVNFVDRKTPTRGRELTILQQLFQNIGRFSPGGGGNNRGPIG